ncbi:MAG: aminoacyl-tRNA hydrolase [Candidatus Obscuribacterales bacterium]|nr:aminoacyl-tRNA hydrolase [Candidatus Obscuribacterales bacterium]
MGKSNLKMVLVVRKDLKVHKGKIGSQIGHAVQEIIIDRSGEKPKLRDEQWLYDWLADEYPKITVSVNSEAELLAVFEQAKAAGLNAHLVQDLGHTEFKGMLTYTVVSIGPAPAELVDPITGKLPLY